MVEIRYGGHEVWWRLGMVDMRYGGDELCRR